MHEEKARAKQIHNKYDAQLRRMRKANKKKSREVPESIHKLWHKGGVSRRQLLKVLVECEGDKAPQTKMTQALKTLKPDKHYQPFMETCPYKEIYVPLLLFTRTIYGL